MESKAELKEWRALWQAGPGKRRSLAELRDRTMRETRRKRMMLVAPIVVTMAIGGWAIARTVSGTLDGVFLAVEAWLFIAIVWMGSLWIDRGTWRPLGESTSAFLELSIRRCQSAIKAVQFGVLMYLGQLAAILGWKAYHFATDPATLFWSWPAVALGWIGAPLLIGLSIGYVRRKRTELRQLIDFSEELRRE